MSKRSMVSLLIALALIMALSVPALAVDTVNLAVNGEAANLKHLFQENGISMVSLESLDQICGCDVNWKDATEFTVSENGTTLTFNLGSRAAKAASADGQVTYLNLPRAPFKDDGTTYVPLRAVCTALGFKVDWNRETGLVTLERNETRDGMTVADLLAKSNQATAALNTYSMEGTMHMSMDISADGKKLTEAPQEMTLALNGSVQNKPMQLYIKETISDMPGQAEAAVVEVYVNGEKAYTRAPGQDWTTLEMPGLAEMISRQQELQSDPAKAMAMLDQMGMKLTFANDRVIDGKPYYAIDCTVDMEKFQGNLQGIMQQLGMPAGEGTSPEDLQKLLRKMDMDYKYTFFVDKSTFLTDLMDIDLAMALNLDAKDLASGTETAPDAPKSLQMNMAMKGTMKITTMGQPFTAPDISRASKAQ